MEFGTAAERGLERETGFEPATSTLAIKPSGIVLRCRWMPSYECFIRLYSEHLEFLPSAVAVGHGRMSRRGADLGDVNSNLQADPAR
jgi:hypothetical protein